MTLNMKAEKHISNPVEVTMSGAELSCLKTILKEYSLMKECDDFDPDAVLKMKVAKMILDRIEGNI